MWQLIEHMQWFLLEKEFDWVQGMKGVPQDARYHAEGDVAIHTQLVLKALEQVSGYQDLPVQDQHILQAAALLHDVEKRSTTVTEPDGTITSKGHAKRGALTSRSLLYRLSAPFRIREQVCSLVRYHGLPLWALEKKDPQKAVIQASLQVDTKLLAMLASADVLGRIAPDQQELLYRIGLFQALCEETGCWGRPYPFSTAHAKFYYFKREDSYPDFVPFDEFGSTVVLLSGLPGAGKDTYTKQHYRDWPVINLDDIRRAHKISPTDKSGNGTVIQLAKEQARAHLRAQKDFVWNATNITRQLRDQLIELFVTYKAFVRIVYIEAAYKKLHQQNNNREAALPRQIIEKLIDKLEVPLLEEAHEVVYCLEP
ncbi:MAG: AAA family ATPase [Williamsia sp.]|nr:AAA family ATPase [Williamsia sp.]